MTLGLRVENGETPALSPLLLLQSPHHLLNEMSNTAADDSIKTHVAHIEEEVKDVDGSSDTSGTTPPPDAERRLVRKLDMRIMPTVCLIYLFACKPAVIDRRHLRLLIPATMHYRS